MECSRDERFQPAMALGLAGLIVVVILNLSPVITFSFHGRAQSSYLMTGVVSLVMGPYTVLAGLVGLCSIVAPFLSMASLAYAAFAAETGWKLPARQFAVRLLSAVSPWNLVEVYGIATVVAVARLKLLGEVTFHIGALWILCLFIIALLMRIFVSQTALWRRIAAP